MCEELKLCRPFNDPAVMEWASGQTHAIPQFADAMQRDTAGAIRRRTIQEHVINRREQALVEFPEWRWATGITHERPAFANAACMQQAAERREAVLTKLINKHDLAKVREFPEWGAAMSAPHMPANEYDMRRTLWNLPRPRLMKRNGQLRRKYRHWGELWRNQGCGSFKYLRDLVTGQVQKGEFQYASLPEVPPQHQHEFTYWQPTVRFRRQEDGLEVFDRPYLTPSLVAWMNGESHVRPPTDGSAVWYSEDRRKFAFHTACLKCLPGLANWPEFQAGIDKLGLRVLLDREIITTEVAGMLVSQVNRRVGSWYPRLKRMLRDGKNPFKRRRYQRAKNQVRTIEAIAMKILDERRARKVVAFVARGKM